MTHNLLTNRLLLSAAFLPLLSMAPHHVFADEDAHTHYPSISGEAVFEIQLEHGYDSDDPDNERTNTFGRVEVAPTVQLSEHFFIDGVAVVEPVQDGDPGDDIYFDNEGIFIEELKLNYEHGPWAVFAGKFNPGFGIAWDFGRGIWSEDFAEDYEITEKIGVGAAYTLETAHTGNHTITANTFFADNTFLSESTITARGRTRESDGGASNTEDFSSFVVSLDGENVGGIEDLYYHISFRHLAEGDATVGGDDEQGVAANINYIFSPHHHVESDILLEFVHINNFDASLDDHTYYTASLVNVIDEHWNVTFGYTQRDIDVASGSDMDDHLFQVSGGYDFLNGLTAEIGWRNSEEDSVENNIIGGLLRYIAEF